MRSNEIIAGQSNRNEQQRNGGFAMAAMLCAVIILFVMGASVLSLGMHSRGLAVRTASDIKARAAADAGLTKTVFQMNELLENRTWDPVELQYQFDTKVLPYTTDESLPYCEATYDYKVTPTGKKSNNEFAVTCSGKSGNSVKTVHAIVKVKSIFDSALLVKDRISLMPKSLVDGYNSSDPFDPYINIKIGTTSTLDGRIPLGPGTVVNGDIFVGVEGDPQDVIGAGGSVNGRKFALLDDIDLPKVTPPPLPDKGKGLQSKSGIITIGPADSGKYANITLENSKVPGGLEITGGRVVLYITGNITMGKGCEVIVRAGSSLVIYVDGDVTTENSTGFNNEAGNIKKFALYATGTNQTFNLKAKSSIFGVVYAPDVDINMYPGSTVNGAIVGKNITFKSGGSFYYDEALQDASIYEEAVHFAVTFWQDE